MLPFSKRPLSLVARRTTPALIALALCAGCATNALITLETTPDGAHVWVRPIGGGEFRDLGQTPMALHGVDLLREGGPGPVYLEFRKEGHMTSRTLVTDYTTVNLSINMTLTRNSGLESQERINAAIDSLFEAQRLARAGRPEDAIARLRALERDAPDLAATYELEGGIFYLQRRYAESLDAFSIATKLNPSSLESRRMKQLLESSLLDPARQPAATPVKRPGGDKQ